MQVRIREFDQESINDALRQAEHENFMLVDHEIVAKKNKIILFFQEVTE